MSKYVKFGGHFENWSSYEPFFSNGEYSLTFMQLTLLVTYLHQFHIHEIVRSLIF